MKKKHHTLVTLRQYFSMRFSFIDPIIFLSCKVANLKIMFGFVKRVMPKTKSNEIQITIGYNFKNRELLVIKQIIPTASKKIEDSKGLTLNENRFLLSGLFLGLIFVAERK